MSFETLMRDLFEDGRVRISTGAAPTDDELQAAGNVICEFERRYRLDLPGTPPEISRPAAVWAAEMFYGACQCLTFREIDAADMQQMIRPYSGQADASAHYSVDLTFRLLPDLIHRARAVSREDPLVAELVRLAGAWPLSSVGVTDVEVGNLEPILEHECLRGLYVDRIIASRDVSRLSEPRVREAVLAAVGMHEELAAQMVAAATDNQPNQQDELE